MIIRLPARSRPQRTSPLLVIAATQKERNLRGCFPPLKSAYTLSNLKTPCEFHTRFTVTDRKYGACVHMYERKRGEKEMYEGSE